MHRKLRLAIVALNSRKDTVVATGHGALPFFYDGQKMLVGVGQLKNTFQENGVLFGLEGKV